ncbi:MAG: hypothetical protein QG551_452 [Patescibacteria group bacterium]|nr:hypothetical protein [Patescibacteria group bacterium]
MNLKEIRQSYDGLYREFFTPLFRYFFFRTKNNETSKDLTQSVFLKFLNQGYKEREKEHNVKLLFTIARTSLIDFYRKSSRRLEESLDAKERDVPSSDPDPEIIFESKEKVSLVQDVLKTLSESEEEIVVLRMTTDMSYKEMAKVLELKEDNIRQIYSRALKKMKDYMDDKQISYE